MADVPKDIGGELEFDSSILAEEYAGTADVDGDGANFNPDGTNQQFLSGAAYCLVSGGTEDDEIVFVLQDSSDDGDSDDFTDITDQDGERFEVTVVADGDGEGEGRIDLTNAQFERYVRVIVDDDASDLEGADADVHAVLVKGGAMQVPVDR